MTSTARDVAVERMRAAGVSSAAVSVFAHNFDVVAHGAGQYLREADLDPVRELDSLADVEVADQVGIDAIRATAVIRLNGGLGTSMGLDAAKTLLPVREGLSFLDVIAGQVLAARSRYGARLPLVLMNSFRTEADTVEALRAHPTLPVAGLPMTFVQSQAPKLLADSLEPVQWPADPSLEWCPPGHGDLYPCLVASGLLDALLDEGFRYALIANGDNLGAVPDSTLAGWFASSETPFALEVCRRTVNDRKGGHLARRRADGRLVLRESAMVAPSELTHFADEDRHPFFNTNNMWVDLERLREALAERDGVLGLPVIQNHKTVDPTDPTSPAVIQLETAMGAAIETFAGASAIEVPRSRFLPVKTTNELLLVRSDCYELRHDFVLESRVGTAPEIRLDARYFQHLADFDRRIPVAPSLLDASRLAVHGDWTFEPGTVVVGDVELSDAGEPRVARGLLQ